MFRWRGGLGHPALLGMLLLVLAACAPQAAQFAPPTPIPFPTMTPGSQLTGGLPTSIPADVTPMTNPATAVALASLPTATPDYSACPTETGGVSFSGVVEAGLSVLNGIPAFLNQGGSVEALRAGLQANNLLGETGQVAATYDFTGEAVLDLVMTLTLPDRGGVVLLLVCENGQYVTEYQAALGDTAPEIVRVADLNADDVPDLLLAGLVCSPVDDLCQYRTGVVTWDARAGQFVNLLLTPPDGDLLPRTGDVDNDQVVEIITVQEGRGTAATGPLRTGAQIYDWNGVSYVLSVSQPDPLRFVIQVIHEADRAFREERMDAAARLYRTALEDESLGYWIGGEEVALLETYALYRLLLTYTFAENGDPLTLYGELTDLYPAPGEAAPVYSFLADVYWRTFQESNNLNVACSAVLEAVAQRPLALEALNRYGTRNPSYTAESLCPF